MLCCISQWSFVTRSFAPANLSLYLERGRPTVVSFKHPRTCTNTHVWKNNNHLWQAKKLQIVSETCQSREIMHFCFTSDIIRLIYVGDMMTKCVSPVLNNRVLSLPSWPAVPSLPRSKRISSCNNGGGLMRSRGRGSHWGKVVAELSPQVTGRRDLTWLIHDPENACLAVSSNGIRPLNQVATKSKGNCQN